MSSINNSEEDLNSLISNLKNINGKNEVPLEEVFDTTFMKTHSQYSNIMQFLKSGGFDPFNLNNEDESKLSNYINLNTDYSSWDNFANSAEIKWINKKLDN